MVEQVCVRQSRISEHRDGQARRGEGQPGEPGLGDSLSEHSPEQV